MTTPRPLLSAYNSREEWEAALDKWLEVLMDEDELEMDEEDRYDRFGNVSENGIYDAGGHLVEDWYNRIDEESGR